MATSVLSARSAAVTMSSDGASSCSVIAQSLSGPGRSPHLGCSWGLRDRVVRWTRGGRARDVIDRQRLTPSPTGHVFRTLDSAMPATERLPGTLGPYRLQDRLGEGGMGVVHLARDPAGQLVAVKVLHVLSAEDPNARRRLGREVETMRRVH